MLNCIAIDDEPKALDIINLYANKVPFIELKKCFRDAIEALTYISRNEVDLIFLDINMPDLNGIEFLDSLKKQPLVIFTTAYSEYAVQSYDYKAIDYLLKPFSFARFLKAVNRANDIFSQSINKAQSTDEESAIIIKSGTNKHTVKLKDILYAEGAQNYIFIHTQEQKIMTLMRMKDIEKELPNELFCRVHKSFIVALNKVERVEKAEIIVRGKKIPIGKTYKELFTRRLSSE